MIGYFGVRCMARSKESLEQRRIYQRFRNSPHKEAGLERVRHHEKNGAGLWEAWSITEKEFFPDEPAPKSDEHSESSKELVELLERTEQLPINVKDDLMWVYQSRGIKNLSPKDAPSLGAWDMLQYSRTNRVKYTDLVFKHLLQKDDDSKDKWKIDDGRILKVIEKLRRQNPLDRAPEPAVV